MKTYQTPQILEEVSLDLEAEILKGSIIDTEKTEVESVGQEVVTIKADQFTSHWE